MNATYVHLVAGALAFGSIACETVTTQRDTRTTDAGPIKDAGDTVAALRWYTTCGDPACMGYTPKAGVDPCTAEAEGEACTTAGVQCDPKSDCNALLRCTDSDPKQQPGGCPISRRAVKTAIHYLGDSELQALSRELQAFPLATWQYLDAPSGERSLGFVLEDVEPSPAADSRRDRVDLYAYTTMAVAALKVQAARIEALEREVERLRAEQRGRALTCPAP